MAQSWMVGDRDSDIACGRAAGVKTIHIGLSNVTAADHTVPSLIAAAPILCA
jgi:phosphoglycolate phosphatase-like HAD superfamily hydrolase